MRLHLPNSRIDTFRKSRIGIRDTLAVVGIVSITQAAPAAAPNCNDQENPLFGSCLDQFLAGCYEPDLTGTCAADDGSVSWRDGSKVVRSGARAGLYRAGSDQACITVALSAAGAVLSKGKQQLSYGGAGDQVTVDCPDGSQLHAAGEQLSHQLVSRHQLPRLIGLNRARTRRARPHCKP